MAIDIYFALLTHVVLHVGCGQVQSIGIHCYSFYLTLGFESNYIKTYFYIIAFKS